MDVIEEQIKKINGNEELMFVEDEWQISMFFIIRNIGQKDIYRHYSVEMRFAAL